MAGANNRARLQRCVLHLRGVELVNCLVSKNIDGTLDNFRDKLTMTDSRAA
jgi:hypothetical protein